MQGMRERRARRCINPRGDGGERIETDPVLSIPCDNDCISYQTGESSASGVSSLRPQDVRSP